MMHGYGYEFGWGGMLIGGLMMFLFWGGLIALVIWGVKSVVSSSGRSVSSGQNAREILDQRYARGEIDRDEYETMKADLAA